MKEKKNKNVKKHDIIINSILRKNYMEEFMEKLTKEEVLHVAKLARIEVTEEEIENYSMELKQLLNEVDKIKEIENYDCDLMITPVEHEATMREDQTDHIFTMKEVKENAPRTSGNFVEVPVMINE